MRSYTHTYKGKISLVGAGPGDPELITVKGLKAIQRADVILYDALVNPLLLSEAKSEAVLEYVGKRAGKHKVPQEEINRMLVDYAHTHPYVVRLKGGDPFVFGRGFEEMAFARDNGLSVEVIPGISSSTSLAGLQGVPITCRGINESFWVVTATTRNGTLPQDMYLAAESSASIVVLMGIKKIKQIVQIFQEKGKGETPCLVVQNGSRHNEKYVLGSLNTIVDEMTRHQIGSPGIIYIGEVVKLHPAWASQTRKTVQQTVFQRTVANLTSVISPFSKSA
ncbi:MAG: uroporphyrinogen-III C-methyltransferase [Bacteroidota bacterium]